MAHVAVVYEYGAHTEQAHAQHGDEHVAYLQRLYDRGALLLSGCIDIDGPTWGAARPRGRGGTGTPTAGR